MATIFKLSDGIAIENDSLRLTFPLASGLVGKFSLFARKNDRFELAATCSPVAEICAGHRAARYGNEPAPDEPPGGSARVPLAVPARA